MNRENVSFASDGIAQRAASDFRSTTVIAICCLATILALVLGVGLASNLVLRHLMQTAPLQRKSCCNNNLLPKPSNQNKPPRLKYLENLLIT